jgi:AhpD family alkylhydroperoxidase
MTIAADARDAAPRFEEETLDVLKLFMAAGPAIESHGVEAGLFHLIKLRASQINRCAFCVAMHTREARQDGETSERLDRLVVFDQVDDFTPAEKAALAWTEALTALDHRRDLAPLRTALRDHYSEEQIAAITEGVALINLWNRIGVSRH